MRRLGMETVFRLRKVFFFATARNTLRLCAGLVGAYGLYLLNSFVRVPGLGWAHAPGLGILSVLAVLGVLAFDKDCVGRLAVALGCFAGSIAVEFLPIRPIITAFIGFAFVLFGEILIGLLGLNRKLAFLFFAVGSCIEAVFIYNCFYVMGHMYFFKPGWTA